MQIVTLTTDFGAGDYDIGSMMGVIWNIAPTARLVDLSHDIERHSVRQAAIMLDRCTPYFPTGTVHVVVVDPGVGTERRPIAAQLGSQWYVGPDNGILTLMRRRAIQTGQLVKIVHTDNRLYWLPQPSSIFHGRDVFAPVGGHLAAGTPLSELGPEIDDPVLLDFPEPDPKAGGWEGQVTDIDHFGNLGTNIHRDHLKELGSVKVLLREHTIPGVVNTFGEGQPGELVALIDSSNYLSICVVNGNAAANTATQIGDPVTILPVDSPTSQ